MDAIMEPDLPTALSRPVEHSSIDAAILDELMDLYLSSHLAEGVITPATHRIYEVQLRPFREYWRQCPHEHGYQLSRAVLARALEWIRAEYIGPKGKLLAYVTVEDCFVRLRGLFHWLYKRHCTGSVDLATWCPEIKHIEPDQYYPTIEEVQRLLDAPTGNFRLRDVTLMTFLISTGARRNEAACAQTGDVEFLTPMTDVTVGNDHRGWCLLRVTKGDRDGVTGGRPVVFCTTAGLLLKVYLRSVSRPPEERIFGIGDVAIGQMIQRHTTAIGVPEISPHAFRRLFSDYWYECQPELERLRKAQLGHSISNQDVTMRHYTNHRNKRRTVQQLLERHVSPLDRICLDWSRFPVQISSDACLST
jgi:integrase